MYRALLWDGLVCLASLLRDRVLYLASLWFHSEENFLGPIPLMICIVGPHFLVLNSLTRYTVLFQLHCAVLQIKFSNFEGFILASKFFSLKCILIYSFSVLVAVQEDWRP